MQARKSEISISSKLFYSKLKILNNVLKNTTIFNFSSSKKSNFQRKMFKSKLSSIKIFLIRLLEHEVQFKQQCCNSRVRGKFTNDKARRGNDMKIVSL